MPSGPREYKRIALMDNYLKILPGSNSGGEF